MMGNIAEKSTCNKSTGYIAYIFGIVNVYIYVPMIQQFQTNAKFFFKNISYFSKHILSKFIYKKKKKSLQCTSYFTLNVKFQSCQFLYKLVKWLNTNQLPQNGQLTMPYHTGFLMLHTILCTKKTFDMQSINYPNNYTSPNKILVIRQNAHLVLRNVGKTL